MLVLQAEDATSGEMVVIKFSPSYGMQVHTAWASVDLAPKLYSCSLLPGGYWMIVMELLDPRDGWASLTDLRLQDAVLASKFVSEALKVAQSSLPGGLQ